MAFAAAAASPFLYASPVGSSFGHLSRRLSFGAGSTIPITQPQRRISHCWRIDAKFVKFEPPHGENGNEEEELRAETVTVAKNSDSTLPSDMEQAVLQSGKSTAQFISSGGMRAIVELLLPELEFLDNEGSQEGLWRLARLFLESVKTETATQQLKAIFPDAGAAALLKHLWKDANFEFASLSDRRPVDDNDEIVVMIAPDYQMLESVEKIAASLSEDLNPRPLVMWNPRLYSGDVGIGLNVKRLRQYFLSTFTVVYSLRTVTAGAVFRCYPKMWQIFINDKERPGCFILAHEHSSRPDAEVLDMVLLGESVKQEERESLTFKARSIIASFNRFVKSISR